MPRVMIVEDDLTILDNLAQLLELSGLDVTKAHDGLQAMRLLGISLEQGSSLPGLIVSDLMMPNMDGFDLLKAVRAHEALSELPVVLLSARSDAADLHQAFALGASDYLVKPFEVEHLIEVIRYHLSIGVSKVDPGDKGPAEGTDAFHLE